MRPVGFHPGQLLAQQAHGLQPACPVECGLAERVEFAYRPLPAAGGAQPPSEPPARQPLGDQPAPESCRVVRVGRWSIDCTVHGFVRVDELTYPLVCPRRGEGA